METTAKPVYRWHMRPVFFVADVHRAIRFYGDMLGFEKSWHEADGAGTVCQVHRGQCEIILCRVDTVGRVFRPGDR